MYLRNQSKTFSLSIEGYEYNEADNQEDLDWLIVKTVVNNEEFEWTATGPFLRIQEINKIVNWVNSIVKAEKFDKRIVFIEHELSFEYNNGKFSVFLDFNAHPKGNNYDYESDREYRLDFEVTLNELERINDKLAATLLKYPQRIK